MKRSLIPAAFAAGLLLLSGCALPSGPPSEDPFAGLTAIVDGDIDAAIAIAEAGGDPDAAACYREIKKVRADRPDLGTPAGAVSAFERLRLLRRSIDAGLPESLHVACAPVVIDAERTLIRLGLIAAGAGGVPSLAAGGSAPR
jgi:hypothetical protein